MKNGSGSGVCVVVRDRAEDITKQQQNGCFPYSLGKRRGAVGPTESPEVAGCREGGWSNYGLLVPTIIVLDFPIEVEG